MILRTKEQFMKYLDCTADEVLLLMKEGLPTVELITDLGFFTTDRLVDEWVEARYRQTPAPAGQPVKFFTTENLLEDLRTVIHGLRDDGSCKDTADLLARLEYCLELLEGRHPESFDPLKDMEGA